MEIIQTDTIHIGGRKHVVPDQVILLIADINYTVLHFADGRKTIVATCLKYLEKRFLSYGFFRPNRSYVINPYHIITFGQSSIKMSNGYEVMISRRRKSALQKAIYDCN